MNTFYGNKNRSPFVRCSKTFGLSKLARFEAFIYINTSLNLFGKDSMSVPCHVLQDCVLLYLKELCQCVSASQNLKRASLLSPRFLLLEGFVGFVTTPHGWGDKSWNIKNLRLNFLTRGAFVWTGKPHVLRSYSRLLSKARVILNPETVL